ncbi:MAG: hypothetical protein ACI8W8_001066 [Rhodothermales bacterium]
MKLVHASHELRGKAVELSTFGYCIGRESDNDLVVIAPEISGYHCKIDQRDGLWHIRDLDSTNGVYLNEGRVKSSALLSIDDVIRVGDRVFIFTDNPHPAGLAKIGKAESSGGAANVARGGRKNRILLLAGLLVVFIIGIGTVGIMEGRKQARLKAGIVATEVNDETMVVRYVKVEVKEDSIFRYAFDLDGRSLVVTVDDLINRRQFLREMELSDAQIADIQGEVMIEEFLKLKIPPRQREDVREQYLIMVRHGRRGNAIEITNDLLPAVVNEITMALEDFAELHLGMAAIAITREELVERATERFLMAERLFTEQSVEPTNLYNAVESYRYVIEFLADLTDRPDIYETAFRQRAVASAELEEVLKDCEFAARTHFKLGEYEEAREAYQQILSRVPKRTHPSVERARKQMLAISRQLERSKKRR